MPRPKKLTTAPAATVPAPQAPEAARTLQDQILDSLSASRSTKGKLVALEIHLASWRTRRDEARERLSKLERSTQDALGRAALKGESPAGLSTVVNGACDELEAAVNLVAAGEAVLKQLQAERDLNQRDRFKEQAAALIAEHATRTRESIALIYVAARVLEQTAEPETLRRNILTASERVEDEIYARRMPELAVAASSLINDLARMNIDGSNSQGGAAYRKAAQDLGFPSDTAPFPTLEINDAEWQRIRARGDAILAEIGHVA